MQHTAAARGTPAGTGTAAGLSHGRRCRAGPAKNTDSDARPFRPSAAGRAAAAAAAAKNMPRNTHCTGMPLDLACQCAVQPASASEDSDSGRARVPPLAVPQPGLPLREPYCLGPPGPGGGLGPSRSELSGRGSVTECRRDTAARPPSPSPARPGGGGEAGELRGPGGRRAGPRAGTRPPAAQAGTVTVLSP